MLSEKYNWTPEQIRNQRKEDIEAYLTIINAKNKIAKYNKIKNGR